MAAECRYRYWPLFFRICLKTETSQHYTVNLMILHTYSPYWEHRNWNLQTSQHYTMKLLMLPLYNPQWGHRNWNLQTSQHYTMKLLMLPLYNPHWGHRNWKWVTFSVTFLCYIYANLIPLNLPHSICIVIGVEFVGEIVGCLVLRVIAAVDVDPLCFRVVNAGMAITSFNNGAPRIPQPPKKSGYRKNIHLD